MAKKEKQGMPNFRDCVMERYRKDTVMHGTITLLLILLPVLLFGIFKLLPILSGIFTSLPDFTILNAYPKIPEFICIVIALYIFMAILFQLYHRLHQHSQRDRYWRAALIRYTANAGGDVSEMREYHEKAKKSEKFPGRFFLLFLMGSMFLYQLIVFAYFVPRWAWLGDMSLFTPVFAIGIGICVLTVLTILFKVLEFPYAHGKYQNKFTIALSKSWSALGVKVPPMINVVKHHNIILNILFCVLLFPIFVPYTIYHLFSNMNNHLQNQWVYENELLRVIESGGNVGFKDYLPDYSVSEHKSKLKIRAENRALSSKARKIAEDENKMPVALRIAELFIVFLIAQYIYKIIILDIEITNNYTTYEIAFSSIQNLIHIDPNAVLTLFMVGLDLFFMVWSIRALLGIKSRKPSSWRKVVRSCVTFMLPLWLTTMITNVSGITQMFTNVSYVATTVVLGIICAMMLISTNIKEYYAPVGKDMPGIFTWIRYCFFGKLDEYDRDLSALEEIDDQ